MMRGKVLRGRVSLGSGVVRDGPALCRSITWARQSVLGCGKRRTCIIRGRVSLGSGVVRDGPALCRSRI